MKGFIPRTVLGLSLSLSALAGCAGYREIVDPCWPERYNSMARLSVQEATNVQANHGHILDQTIFNYHFVTDPKTGIGTDKLNAAGVEHLKYITRHRPAPDTQLFLATAQDLQGLSDKEPEKAIAERNDLNGRRIAAIQRYLAVQTNGQGGYRIDIHDPAEPYVPALGRTGSLNAQRAKEVVGGYQKLQDNFQGVLQVDSGATGSGGGGSGSGGSGSSSSGSSSSGSSGSSGGPR